MRTVEQLLRILSADNAGDPRVTEGGSETPGVTPEARPPIQSTFNLARPWRFPAGHPDSFLCRQHSRTPVQIPVEISLYRPDGSSYDQGTGVIRDLSSSGLRLGDVFLSHGRLLATCCEVGLRPALESPGGPDITGRILRTFSSGMPAFGIEFLIPGSGAEDRLRKMR